MSESYFFTLLPLIYRMLEVHTRANVGYMDTPHHRVEIISGGNSETFTSFKRFRPKDGKDSGRVPVIYYRLTINSLRDGAWLLVVADPCEVESKLFLFSPRSSHDPDEAKSTRSICGWCPHPPRRYPGTPRQIYTRGSRAPHG